MRTINVMVRDKIASAVGDIVYICGNNEMLGTNIDNIKAKQK